MISSIFRYQPFVAIFGDLGDKVRVVDNDLSSHEQETYPTTSLDENCIEFEFWNDRDYYVDIKRTYLALKLKFVRDCSYESYNTKEVQKSTKKRQKRMSKRQRRNKGLQFFLLFMYTTFCTQIFPMLKYTSTIIKFKILKDPMHKSLPSPTTSKRIFLNAREFCTARGRAIKNFPMKLWKRLCLKHFSQGQWKCWVHFMAACCMVNWEGLFLHSWIALYK